MSLIISSNNNLIFVSLSALSPVRSSISNYLVSIRNIILGLIARGVAKLLASLEHFEKDIIHS